jgi:TRAP-type uncharacterized transport system substrate-binding protein
MKSLKYILAAFTLVFVSVTSAQGQAQTNKSDSPFALRIATGKQGKGYSKLFSDIQKVCGAQVPMTEIETEGGLQNLTTLAANQADLGLVQLDTLQDMKVSDEGIASLLAVMPINTNLLHILARSEGYVTMGPKRLGGFISGDVSTTKLERFSDLKGLPIAVVGSARALGRVLNRQFGMNLQFVDVDTDEQAIAKLKAAEVAGMLSTSGWPSGPIQKLKRDAGLRLLPFDLAVATPYQLVRKNYENLNTFNHSFLAAPNLLVSRPFTTTGNNGKAVAMLQSCIQKNLVKLQEGQFEPAWREVKNVDDTFGWPRYASATKR